MSKRTSYQTKWDRKNSLIIKVRLNAKKHHDLVSFLQNKENVSGYVRRLIKEDLEHEKETKGN